MPLNAPERRPEIRWNAVRGFHVKNGKLSIGVGGFIAEVQWVRYYPPDRDDRTGVVLVGCKINDTEFVLRFYDTVLAPKNLPERETIIQEMITQLKNGGLWGFGSRPRNDRRRGNALWRLVVFTPQDLEKMGEREPRDGKGERAIVGPLVEEIPVDEDELGF